jgi:hypothetical protein
LCGAPITILFLININILTVLLITSSFKTVRILNIITDHPLGGPSEWQGGEEQVRVRDPLRVPAAGAVPLDLPLLNLI